MNTFLAIGQLLTCLGQIDGRKKLQKITHILQHCGYPVEVEFEFSHYGPYSTDLKAHMDELSKSGLVCEQRHGKTYSFTPTPQLKKLLHEVAAPPTTTRIKKIAKHLNAKDPSELEGISTIIFLRSRGYGENEVKGRFSALKPHLVSKFDVFIQESRSLRSSARKVTR